MAEITTLTLAVDSRQVRQATKDLDGLGVAGGRTERSTNELASVFRTLKGVLAGVGFAQLARAAVDAADRYNTLNSRLRLATSSTKEFVQAQRELFSISQQTGTGLEQTTGLFTSLARSTETLGVSQGQVLEVTKTINQALAVSGTSAQGAQAALVQLGQGFSAGALRGEELNSVLEQAPRLARAIADGLGVTVGQLRQLGQEGQLTGEKVFTALQRSGGAIDAEFRQLPLTVERASTQAGNALLKLIGTLDSATGSTSALAGTIQGAAGFFSELADQIERVRQGQESASLLANAFVTAIEAVQVFGANIVFVFQGVGREIGAVAAQIVALGRLDIGAFRAISDAVTEDARRARAELDAFERRVLSRSTIPELGQNDRRELARRGRNAQPFGFGVEPPAPPPARGGGKAPVADILGFDLAEIRRELDGLTSAYRSAETILEATRAANLVDARTYYQARQQLIRINEEAEVRALQVENARLASEKGNAKEQLETRRKILDNENKIAAIRADAATQLSVLSIQESAALEQLQRGFVEADAAARAYLETLSTQRNREINSLGRGDQQREQDARLAAVEDRFQQQREQLASERRQGRITQEQYDTELELLRRYLGEALRIEEDAFQRRLEKQRDFSVGASEALRNYLDAVNNTAAATKAAFENAFRGLEDSLVTFVQTGKLSFKSFADQIVADLLRIFVRQQIIAPLLNAASAGGGGFFGALTGALFGGGKASGGSTSANRLYRVNERGPEMLSVGSRDYLMMGSQGGRVTPNSALQGQRQQVINYSPTFLLQGAPNRQTQQQLASEAFRGASGAFARQG